MTRPPESLANPRLWLAFTTMLLISGFPNMYILFLPSLLGEFHASRAATALPMSLVGIGGAVLGPAAGWLVARWNPRAVVMTGLAAAACGLALGSVAQTLTVFVITVGAAVGAGLGLTAISTQAALLADAYSQRRGVAMGIAFSGSMAAFVLGPVTQRLIDGFGPDGVSARVIDTARGVVRLQSGYLYHYAFAMLIGVAAFITYFMVSGAR